MTDTATNVTLACLWEVTAPKPGNVYRGADFADMSFTDFLLAATVIGPPLAKAADEGVGSAVLEATCAMVSYVGVNTSLGTILLLAPLAAVPAEVSLAGGIRGVLAGLDATDTRLVYQAIALAQPGGLGRVAEADVNDAPPEIPLTAAMALAADRDLVARQYTNDFAEVFWLADRLAAQPGPLSGRIVRAFLELLTRHPDSLVARKCGLEASREVSLRAARVLAQSEDDSAYTQAVSDLDFWLRADGHRRNPGTSADLVAAALYVLLREERIEWPVKFYG